MILVFLYFSAVAFNFLFWQPDNVLSGSFIMLFLAILADFIIFRPIIILCIVIFKFFRMLNSQKD